MLQSAPKLRNDGSAVKRAWDVYGKKQCDERRAAAWCCVATNRVDAVLHVLLRHYNSRCCGATTRVAMALQLALLWRYNSRYYDATTLQVASYDAAALQLAWLRCCCTLAALLQRCSSHGCIAAALWLRCCGTTTRVAIAHVLFFFLEWLLTSLRVFNLFLYVRKRKKQRARKNKRQLWNLFWFCFS